MRPILVSVLAGGVLLILLLPSLAHRSRQPTGKAPIERLIEGFPAPTGIAVAPNGTLYFTDEDEGSLFQQTPNRTLLLLQDRLRQPRGLVRAEDGTLYLVAERFRQGPDRLRSHGLLLKRSPDGKLNLVASGFQQPQHLFRDPEGSLLLSTTEGLRSSGSRTKDDDDDRDNEDDRKQQQARKSEPIPGVVFRIAPAGQIVHSFPGFRQPAGVWQDEAGQLFVAAEGFRGGGPNLRGSLFRITAAGQVAVVLPERFQGPAGLVQDVLGAFYLAVEEAHEQDAEEDGEEQEPRDGGLLLKVAPGGTFTYFAAGFERPWGLGLDAQGSLYVSDPHAGRIYRFQAPAPPILAEHPAATNQPTVTVIGRAVTAVGQPQPEAWITVRGGQKEEVTTLAGRDGSFTFAGPHAVSLNPDQLNTLQVYATGAQGEGLTSAPTTLTILQDRTPPAVAFLRPGPGSLLSGIVPVEITASDSLSGLAAVELLVDGVLQGRQPAPASTAALERTTFPLDTAAFAPGPHTLTARALDQAGNAASVSISVEFSRLSVTITQPAEGATLNTDRVFVKGLVSGATSEVGVVVNGVAALLTGPQWAAEIPLGVGDNPITVTATDTAGGRATARLTVRVEQAQEDLVALRASALSGLAPLTVRFTVESGLDRPIVKYEFDQNGDGVPDLTSPTFENVQVTYTGPGLITPTLTVTDDLGRTVTVRTLIHMLDKAKTIELFQRKWDALKGALAARDLPRATAEFAFGVRPHFQQVFQALDAQLPTIAPTLGPVAITRVTEGLAEGVTQRVQDGKTFLYFIYWAPDVDGIWRIIEM